MPGRARPDEPLAAFCELRTPACGGPVVVRHHLKGRGRDARYDLLTADCCNACHLYAHANPSESYANGWMLKRHAPFPDEASDLYNHPRRT